MSFFELENSFIMSPLLFSWIIFFLLYSTDENSMKRIRLKTSQANLCEKKKEEISRSFRYTRKILENFTLNNVSIC